MTRVDKLAARRAWEAQKEAIGDANERRVDEIAEGFRRIAAELSKRDDEERQRRQARMRAILEAESAKHNIVDLGNGFRCSLRFKAILDKMRDERE